MQRTVLGRSCLCSLLIAVVLVSSSGGQHRKRFPTPPPPGVTQEPPSPEAKSSAHRVDTFAMEREARELSALASSIPGDVELLKKGLLPSDSIDKLKRIERLSKQLRGQIRP